MKEGYVLFNDALNTFLIRLYGVGHNLWLRTIQIVREENPLSPLYGLLFLISSKGYFICTIPQTGWHIKQLLLHYTSRAALAGLRNVSMGLP